jgi:hypothetical protein
VSRRAQGRLVASLTALIAFAWSGWEAHTSSMPEFNVYDGFWMMLGATIAVAAVAPLVWRWPRQRSLLVVALASIVGSVVPLGISAMRHHMPLMARLRGAWVLAGADLVGPALAVGFVCLWLALREEAPAA